MIQKLFRLLNSSSAVGVQFHNDRLLLARLERVGQSISILSLSEISYDEANVKPLYIEKDVVATVIESSRVLVRTQEIAFSKKKEVDAVAPFIAEPLLPYPLEETILHWSEVRKLPEGTEVAFQSVKKDALREHLREAKSHLIEPEKILSKPTALTALIEALGQSKPYQFWVHADPAEISCILLLNGALIASKSIHIDELAVKENLDDKERILEIIRILYGLSKQLKGEQPVSIGFSGSSLGTAAVREIVEALKAELFEYPEGAWGVSAEEICTYAVPIGAALEVVKKGIDGVDFRKEEFAYPHPWRRLKNPLFIYAGAVLLLSGSLYLAGQSYLHHELANARSQYAELLVHLNKPHKEIEAKLTLNEQDLIQIKHLTAEEMQKRLTILEKEVQLIPQTYALSPNTPRVSDVLAWLSSHPQIRFISSEDGSSTELLRLENFIYTMVKRPDPQRKNEKYQVKVDLEFSSPTPKAAREFHDALIAPNSMVDGKEEVKWSTNRGKYFTSFFLKTGK